MLKLKDTIRNIGDWKTINNDLIYVTDNDIYRYNEGEIILELNEYWGVDFLPEFFNVFTNRSFNTFYSYEGELIKSYDGINFYHIFSKRDFIYYDRKSKTTKYNGLKLIDSKLGLSFLHLQNIFSFQSSSIISINYKKGIKCWQFSFIELGEHQTPYGETKPYEVRQFIGIYKNIVWVQLNYDGLLGIDINTGELSHWFKGVKKENLVGNVDSYIDTNEHYIFYNTEFLLSNNKIIGLAADRFYEINLDSENIQPKLYGLWDKMEILGVKKGNIGYNPRLQNNQLYFMLYDQLKFGTIDILSKEIIYVSEAIEITCAKNSRNQLRDIKVNGDKVYIHDSENTLHIFERENIDNAMS